MKPSIKTIFIVLVAIVLLGEITGVFAQYGGGGGGSSSSSSSSGSSSSLQRDYCPDGDMTFSYYDGLCDENTTVSNTTEVTEKEAKEIFQKITSTALKVITTEEENIIQELKKSIDVLDSPAFEAITLPDFLPETGAL